MELKTLKDLNFIFEDNHPHNRIDEDVKFTLKQEAIKWVNNWLKVLDNPIFFINENHCIGFKKKDMDRMNIIQGEACASIGAFVNFFNITKEDLKDE